jgi:hypothetical protein
VPLQKHGIGKAVADGVLLRRAVPAAMLDRHAGFGITGSNRTSTSVA